MLKPEKSWANQNKLFTLHAVDTSLLLLIYLLLVPNLTGKQACFGSAIHFYLLARNYKNTTLGFLWAFLRFPKV